MAISAKLVGAAPQDLPILAFVGPISELPTAQPATGSAAWRIDATMPSEYHAIIRRGDIGDAVDISVRITDPIGRSSQSLATINPGHILPDPVLANFEAQKSIVPPGTMLLWTSDTPLDPPVYSLQVTVHRLPRHMGRFTIPLPPIVLQMALASVPLDEPGPVPAGADPLRVRRNAAAGPDFSYYAFVRVPFTQIVVALSSPDGRVAQHIELPS
jgi:hypothetical protein